MSVKPRGADAARTDSWDRLGRDGDVPASVAD